MADRLLKFPVYERTPDEKLLDAEWCYRDGFRRGLLWGLGVGFGLASAAIAVLLLT